MSFGADIFPRLETHHYQLAVLCGEQDFAEHVILESRFFDVRNVMRQVEVPPLGKGR
jgi:hypothetical protein